MDQQTETAFEQQAVLISALTQQVADIEWRVARLEEQARERNHDEGEY
jgi:hypothetical protein